MIFDSVMQLSTPVQTLAALGAELRMRQGGLHGDPRVRELLRDVLRAVDCQLLNATDPYQQATALALIQTIFRQAIELMENCERKPGWVHRDPVILQSQGHVSRMIVRQKRRRRTRRNSPAVRGGS
jgi:hypothetical protein